MEPVRPVLIANSTWAERAAERSPAVQRSRERSVERATQIVKAARRLAATKGSAFTTHELVKEAGVAVQTFYKHFEGKDQVLLAVFEDLISETCSELERQGREFQNPIDRLRFYVQSVVKNVGVEGDSGTSPRFITSEHWRLHQLYPEELAQATSAFGRLLLPEIRAAADAGLLDPPNSDYDSWLITQLVIAVFHHYEYARPNESVDAIAERLWQFCYHALGGRPEEEAGRRPAMWLRRSAREGS